MVWDIDAPMTPEEHSLSGKKDAVECLEVYASAASFLIRILK
jgi:hypothetical protein